MKSLEPHVTRPRHFLWPLFLIFLGGAVGTYWIMWVGILICVLGFILSLWLVFDAAVTNTRILIEEERGLMNDEERRRNSVPPPDKVLIEKKETNPTGMNWKYDFLSASPDKMRTIAEMAITGTPFSSRTLTGANKPLSSTEWSTLKDELVEYGLLKPRSEKDERQGYEWTDDGWKMHRDILGMGDA